MSLSQVRASILTSFAQQKPAGANDAAGGAGFNLAQIISALGGKDAKAAAASSAAQSRSVTTQITLGLNLEADESPAINSGYNPKDPKRSLSSGTQTSHFSRAITVTDAAGKSHDLKIHFLKTGINTWAAEVSAKPGELHNGRTDGQIAAGTVKFNGDGSLQSISPSLSSIENIKWAGDKQSQTININFGRPGTVEGLTQFASAYAIRFVQVENIASGKAKSAAANLNLLENTPPADAKTAAGSYGKSDYLAAALEDSGLLANAKNPQVALTA